MPQEEFELLALLAIWTLAVLCPVLGIVLMVILALACLIEASDRLNR
jgi:hypothetical protein